MCFSYPFYRHPLTFVLAVMAVTGQTNRAWCDPSKGKPKNAADDYADYQKSTEKDLRAVYNRWRHASTAGEKERLADKVYTAAIRADRPGIAEQAVAGGPLESCQLPVPPHGERVPLRVVQVFGDIAVDPADEHNPAPNQGANWLARRLTRDALEVWTPAHGWLYDGKGQLLNEARPARQGDATGREWHGAFLPDGRWVTTELSEHDSALSFFSREGNLLKTIAEADLAAPGGSDDYSTPLLGWGRSDKDGAAWVVNVGSEEGRATVHIGPDGPPRPFSGIERWQACYPRALGARGYYISMWVPDDAGGVLLSRSEAGHGPNVGYPAYSVATPKPVPMPEGVDDDNPERLCNVPDGSYVFGFWPGSRNLFIGANRRVDGRGQRAVDAAYDKEHDENATWFFTAKGKFQNWLRGRRIADAAGNDGAMLFRLETDKQIVTLRPDLRAARVRRFTWADGKTAVAYSLFDDLRLGLFEKDGQLALAGWDASK